MESKLDIYCLNGEFLIFNEDHALTLRKLRFIGQFIGCSLTVPQQTVTSSLPILFNHYTISMILEKQLANFLRLDPIKEMNSFKRLESNYSEKLVELTEKAREEFVQNRLEELRRHNVEASSQRLKQFDEKKMRVAIALTPSEEYSSSTVIIMSEEEIRSSLRIDNIKSRIFNDLYKKGFFISSGSKFGCDFLVYCGDPVRYHAKYAVRIIASKDESVDMKKINYSEINALYRLCHTANKIALFSTVCEKSMEVKYWILRYRDYLSPHSSCDNFVTIIPSLNSV